MRTLADALEYGLISPVLAELWCKANNLPSPYHAAFRRQIAFILFLIGTIFVSNGWWLWTKEWCDDLLPYAICAIGGMTLFFSFLGLKAWIGESKRADIKFLHDCTELNSYFPSQIARYGKEDLERECKRKLTALASQLLNAENTDGRESMEAERLRNLFKKTHAAMLRFRLVAEEWNFYFAATQS